MGEFYLFRDNDVKIDFELPQALNYLVREADEFYEADDWFEYDMRCYAIESTCKQYLICGLITKEQFDTIWKRYGIS